MGKAEKHGNYAQVSEYYAGYLKNAVNIFETAIVRLRHSDLMKCDLSDVSQDFAPLVGNKHSLLSRKVKAAF